MFGEIFYYLWGGERGTKARVLGFCQPLLLALEEMLPDLFVRKVEEMLQPLISCQIKLP